MKLKLAAEGKIAVLDVSEDVKADSVPILKAGITKLLASGKNQIVLNLLDAKQISVEVIGELVGLQKIAAELKGEIVLAGQGDLVKQALKSLSSPPALKYFATREAAIGSFKAAVAASQGPSKPASNLPDPTDELKTKIAALEAENKTLKGQVSNRSGEDPRKSKAEVADLKEQVKSLEEQLLTLTKERKKPLDNDAFERKIAQLEAALGEALGKEGLVAKS